jgi:glucose dehydrogenase
MLSGLSAIDGFFYYGTAIPLICILACILLSFLGFWRSGLHFWERRRYAVLFAIQTAMYIPVLLIGNDGPVSAVPWNNRLKFIIASSAAVFFASQAVAVSAVPGEPGSEPRTTSRSQSFELS